MARTRAQALLASIVANPDTPIGRLSLLQPAEVNTLLNKFNTAEAPPSELLHEQQTLHGLLEHWAAAAPEAPAADYEVCLSQVVSCVLCILHITI